MGLCLGAFVIVPTASAKLINNDQEENKPMAQSLSLASFSTKKISSMTISNKSIPVQHPPLKFDGEAISQVYRHKHLRITLSIDLTWRSHIDDIVSKADTRLITMSRLYFLLDRKHWRPDIFHS